MSNKLINLFLKYIYSYLINISRDIYLIYIINQKTTFYFGIFILNYCHIIARWDNSRPRPASRKAGSTLWQSPTGAFAAARPFGGKKIIKQRVRAFHSQMESFDGHENAKKQRARVAHNSLKSRAVLRGTARMIIRHHQDRMSLPCCNPRRKPASAEQVPGRAEVLSPSGLFLACNVLPALEIARQDIKLDRFRP